MQTRETKQLEKLLCLSSFILQILPGIRSNKCLKFPKLFFFLKQKGSETKFNQASTTSQTLCKGAFNTLSHHPERSPNLQVTVRVRGRSRPKVAEWVAGRTGI